MTNLLIQAESIPSMHNTSAIIFVIAIVIGIGLHFIFSRTKLYHRQFKGKGCFVLILYFLILIIADYIIIVILMFLTSRLYELFQG